MSLTEDYDPKEMGVERITKEAKAGNFHAQPDTQQRKADFQVEDETLQRPTVKQPGSTVASETQAKIDEHNPNICT